MAEGVNDTSTPEERIDRQGDYGVVSDMGGVPPIRGIELSKLTPLTPKSHLARLFPLHECGYALPTSCMGTSKRVSTGWQYVRFASHSVGTPGDPLSIFMERGARRAAVPASGCEVRLTTSPATHSKCTRHE
jgi:hypothetical protein